MTRERRTFETVEELATYVVAMSTYGQNDRYTLHSYTRHVWDDPEAGEAWTSEYQKLPHRIWDEDDPRYAENELAYLKYNSREPSKHQVTVWYLERCGDGYSRLGTVYLSETLGELVNQVWTKKPGRYSKSHLERVGALTLKGIVKRLGKSDIGKQVQDAIDAENARRAKVARNYDRKTAREAAVTLLTQLDKGSGVVYPEPDALRALLLQVAQMEDEA